MVSFGKLSAKKLSKLRSVEIKILTNKLHDFLVLHSLRKNSKIKRLGQKY